MNPQLRRARRSDNAASDALTGIAGRLSRVIVGALVHDDGLAHDVGRRIAVQRRAGGGRVDLRHAFAVRLDVQHVAGVVVRATGRIAVLGRRGIEMTAGAAAVRSAADTFLVDVEAEFRIGLQALHGAGDVHTLRRGAQRY